MAAAEVSKVFNWVTVNGELFTHTGRRYSHVVVFVRHDGTCRVEWASSEALATKKLAGHLKRWRAVLAGQTLSYPWRAEPYHSYQDIRIEPVDNDEARSASA